MYTNKVRIIIFVRLFLWKVQDNLCNSDNAIFNKCDTHFEAAGAKSK